MKKTILGIAASLMLAGATVYAGNSITNKNNAPTEQCTSCCCDDEGCTICNCCGCCEK